MVYRYSPGGFCRARLWQPLCTDHFRRLPEVPVARCHAFYFGFCCVRPKLIEAEEPKKEEDVDVVNDFERFEEMSVVKFLIQM